MTTIVAIHGVWNHRRGMAPSVAAQSLASDWSRALGEGPFGALPEGTAVTAAYYAHRLRRPGSQAGEEEDPDRLSPLARTLVGQWLDEVEARPGTPQGALTRQVRQDLARFATRWGPNRLMFERAIAALFGEVARYLDPDTPNRVLARTEVANAIAAANRDGATVVLAHSLGSVVTYETLHAYPQLVVDHLITVGSPLALPQAVFHRLSPAPTPRGARPPNTRRWTNIADKGDVIAVPARGVRDNFDGVDHDSETAIHIMDFHLAANYLSTQAVADALSHTIE